MLTHFPKGISSTVAAEGLGDDVILDFVPLQPPQHCHSHRLVGSWRETKLKLTSRSKFLDFFLIPTSGTKHKSRQCLVIIEKEGIESIQQKVQEQQESKIIKVRDGDSVSQGWRVLLDPINDY
jgi:hypothetical protein